MTKKSLQFVLKGAVNYKSKLVQAMAWHREDTKPLPESVVIQANGVNMSLSDWLSWLFHVLGRYIHTEKNGTVWAHEGYLHPHSWKWTSPTPQAGSGRGTGWPYFVKSPVAGTLMLVRRRLLNEGKPRVLAPWMYLHCLINHNLGKWFHNYKQLTIPCLGVKKHQYRYLILVRSFTRCFQHGIFYILFNCWRIDSGRLFPQWCTLLPKCPTSANLCTNSSTDGHPVEA